MLKTALTTGFLLLVASLPLAQEKKEPSERLPPGPNPHVGNAASIRGGQILFRTRCGECHGLDAKGYRGPDLTALIASGVTDERLFQSIRKGFPGTEMGPTRAPDDDLLMVIAYLRNLSTVPPSEVPSGNVEHGRSLFTSLCMNCHRVGPRGGRLGPELTRIGVARSRASLVREIRTPSEFIPPNYETVTVVTQDGQKIRGVKKNEDIFSIQVMDMRERLQGYLRSSVKDVVYEKVSLMPAYGPSQLSDNDLNDLVGYLTTLRGESAPTTSSTKD